MQAMIFAAGLGTRLKPFTNHHPKALAVVNGKTLLQRNIEYLQQFGIFNVVVNVHHFANQIVEAIEVNNGWGSHIIISDETDAVLETGGGLVKAATLLQDENFVVMNADILTNLNITNMLQQHLQQQPLATLAVTNRNTSRYFLFNQQMQLQGWRNVQTQEEKGPIAEMPEEKKKFIQQMAFSGVHIINKNIFKYIQQQGKFSMVAVYISLCIQHPIIGFNHSNDILVDVGKPENIVLAEKLFK